MTEHAQWHGFSFGDVDYRWLVEILWRLRGYQPSKWAVLCVCFHDDPALLPDLEPREWLFTGEGSGTMNMVDYFNDMSHGKLDLSDSEVLGWYRLATVRADYVGNVYPQPTGKLNRNGLLQSARDAATAAGVNLARFDGVVVSAFGGTDLCGWVGGMAALCDDNSLQPSLLGQEMGHGYGLDHARLDGSPADYMDPWDVMSTAAWPSMQSPNKDYGSVGPGLNAWNMRSRGWLDENRVWHETTSPPQGAVVTLRPLHERGLPGYLAAELGPYLLELRVPERWDAAIPRAAVLVHRFEGNRSYLVPAVNGSQDLVAGDVFRHGHPGSFFTDFFEAEVISIDTAGRSAAIRLTHQFRIPLTNIQLVGQLVGGVAIDGGGGILIGGVYHPIPPRGPEYAIAQALAEYLAAPTTSAVAPTLEVRRSLLEQLVGHALALHATLDLVSETPPGYGPR